MKKFKFLSTLRYHKIAAGFSWLHPNRALKQTDAPDVPLGAWRNGLFFVLQYTDKPKYKCFIYDKDSNTWYTNGRYYFRHDFVVVNDPGQKVIQLLTSLRRLDYSLLSPKAREVLSSYERIKKASETKYEAKKFHRRIKRQIKEKENERLLT